MHAHTHTHQQQAMDQRAASTSTSPTIPKRKGKVTTSPGLAIGYQRCWSQRSADHRGTPQFNGIVCTLLSDEEVGRLQDEEQQKQKQQLQPQTQHQPQNNQQLQSTMHPNSSSSIRRSHVSMTEGLIYTIDEELVHDCLAELDFREKGVSHISSITRI